jgi:hypothetical protein
VDGTPIGDYDRREAILQKDANLQALIPEGNEVESFDEQVESLGGSDSNHVVGEIHSCGADQYLSSICSLGPVTLQDISWLADNRLEHLAMLSPRRVFISPTAHCKIGLAPSASTAMNGLAAIVKASLAPTSPYLKNTRLPWP